MIQLLTATGSRPEAMALCYRWMRAQTYGGSVVWIIVDDGTEPTIREVMPSNWQLVYIRPSPLWQPGRNTQARNLLKGIEACDLKLPLAVIEDDDHYACDWLGHVSQQLQSAELVGEFRARYYNVALKRGRQLSNTKHSSLCSTAMRGSVIDSFRKACVMSKNFIDITLWKYGSYGLSKKLFGGNRVVGIKGLPGRSGIGMGHRNDFSGQSDPSGSLLKSWIGDDARHYL